MIDYKKFEEKIKTMSAHDIIMSMVEVLRNPKTKIDMNTFGEIRKGICFGCAATNAVLNIMDANEDEVKSHIVSTEYDDYTLFGFEGAINLLRLGWLDLYNENAKTFGFAQIIPIPDQNLPFLDNDYTEEELKEYEKLAKYQLTIKTQNND